jgi:hypothetical protein
MSLKSAAQLSQDLLKDFELLTTACSSSSEIACVVTEKQRHFRGHE